MAPDEQHLHLLALCALEGTSWYAIARAAQEPAGLDRLLAGELDEDSKEARATAAAVQACRAQLATHVARARDEVTMAAEKVGARLVTVLDDDYPANLRLVFNLPPFLFVRGELRREDARSVAVVGTRAASAEGLKRARQMARSLVADDVTVLSGLAKGIDATAHAEALDQGGRTIAVLGTGILRTYPAENKALAERIVASGAGALVSQFWPTQPPNRTTFPRRNVVTSGMSQGSVVIEASKTSGAKMQARLALQHGKYAFLLDSLVTDQPWAQEYLERYPRAIRVASIAEVVQRLRSMTAVESDTASRRQLALELF